MSQTEVSLKLEATEAGRIGGDGTVCPEGGLSREEGADSLDRLSGAFLPRDATQRAETEWGSELSYTAPLPDLSW